MKKFLIKVLCVVNATLVVLFVIDRHITYNLHRSDARMFRNWNEVIFDTTYHDLILSGSSRCWHFYNPRIIDSICKTNCYNLGLDGHQITSQIARYNVYCNTHRKPKWIVQNVDFFTLTYSSKFEREQFTPYLRIDTLFNQIYVEEDFSLIDYYVPFIRYIGYRNVIFEGLGLHNDIVRCSDLYKGYSSDNGTWEEGNHHTLYTLSFANDSSIDCLFSKYLDRCHKDGIKVILIYGPIYRGNSILANSVEEEKMYAWFNQKAKQYGCEVINYLHHPICYDKQYFYNATHINKKGSEIISIKLAHDLDSLGIHSEQ